MALTAQEIAMNTGAGIDEAAVVSGVDPVLNTMEMNMDYATGGKSLLGSDGIKLDSAGLGSKTSSGMFSGDNIGSTMQGIGSIATAAAGIYDAHNKKKYQDKVFGMEEQRVARATERQDKQQAAYDKVFG